MHFYINQKQRFCYHGPDASVLQNHCFIAKYWQPLNKTQDTAHSTIPLTGENSELEAKFQHVCCVSQSVSPSLRHILGYKYCQYLKKKKILKTKSQKNIQITWSISVFTCRIYILLK